MWQYPLVFLSRKLDVQVWLFFWETSGKAGTVSTAFIRDQAKKKKKRCLDIVESSDLKKKQQRCIHGGEEFEDLLRCYSSKVEAEIGRKNSLAWLDFTVVH